MHNNAPNAIAAPPGLQREQKLSDMGARVARVVHELNVPLSLIVGSLQALEQYTAASVRYIHASTQRAPADQELRALHAELELDYLTAHAQTLLQICREGASRLDHVVRQVRMYASTAPEVDPPARVDLATVIDEAIHLASCGRTIVPSIQRALPPALDIRGVGESLSQAFVNILSNAFDAASTGAEPRVWVSAHAQPTPGRGWVEVEIRDNGPGVPARVRPRVFEAFFTTKTGRSGMGLGLAITKEIVETHGGTIALHDSDGPGAAFVIRLPVDSRPL